MKHLASAKIRRAVLAACTLLVLANDGCSWPRWMTEKAPEQAYADSEAVRSRSVWSEATGGAWDGDSATQGFEE